MRLLSLAIRGFRGIARSDLFFGKNTVLIGPNGVGKSSLVDALSLVFGRIRLVRPLTEHDFYGSAPDAASRIRIVATLADFRSNDPAHTPTWFRAGRAVPKWWNVESRRAMHERQYDTDVLCAQIAFAARFDLDSLEVEQIRYFHDDDALEDPFLEEAVTLVPSLLLNDIGYYVLPARRTWEGAATFSSELFRRVVANESGIPADAIVAQRDALRSPDAPLEDVPALRSLFDRLNAHLAGLLPSRPQFQLRVTSGDVESLMQALIPHYKDDNTHSLPVSRHGAGLLSLQTFVLLLETGRPRRERGLPFILAVEEPELHSSPGVQRRLMGLASSVADQTICTTHAPRIAAVHEASDVIVLERREGVLQAAPLLQSPLAPAAQNAIRRLFVDERARVVEALMFPRVLVPEGKTDYEWLRLLVEVEDTAGLRPAEEPGIGAPFGSVVGVIPTPDSHVLLVHQHLRRVRDAIIVLLDGDGAGNEYVRALLHDDLPPSTIIQWPANWRIEHVVGWILEAAPGDIVRALDGQVDPSVTDVASLVTRLLATEGPGHLKSDLLSYERIASAIRGVPLAAARARIVLDALARAAFGECDGANLVRDERSTNAAAIVRFSPA